MVGIGATHYNWMGCPVILFIRDTYSEAEHDFNVADSFDVHFQQESPLLCQDRGI